MRFEFDSPLRREDLSGLPPDTIVACGLDPGAYEMLDLPYLRWYCYISRGSIGFSDYSVVWVDECVTEYGYLSTVNNFYFNLLFSIRPVSRGALAKYEDSSSAWRASSTPVGRNAPERCPSPCRTTLACATAGSSWAGPWAGGWTPSAGSASWGSLMSGPGGGLGGDLSGAGGGGNPPVAPCRWRFFYGFKNGFYYRLQPHHVALLDGVNRVIGLKNMQRLNDVGLRRGLPAGIPGYARFMGFK